MELLYLSRQNIEEVNLSMSDIIKVLEEAFIEKGKGKIEMPPKPGIHTQPDAFIHAMLAYIPSLNASGIKWVGGYPENYKKKLPYITGLLILNDPNTGIPISIMDCTWITAMRTGAASAIAAKRLARTDSETIGILACGVQGRTNLEALLCVMSNVKKIIAYDIDETVKIKYCEEMTKRFEIQVIPAKNDREAVVDSDIIITSGPILKNPSPVIEKEWFKSGAFACPVDFDSYWKPSALHGCDKFYTDDIAQLKYYQSIGYFSDIPEILGDLGDLVIQKIPGRQNNQEKIICMNLGLALEDIATASIIYKLAKERNIGQWLMH